MSVLIATSSLLILTNFTCFSNISIKFQVLTRESVVTTSTWSTWSTCWSSLVASCCVSLSAQTWPLTQQSVSK
jgi:hypothetical protein